MAKIHNVHNPLCPKCGGRMVRNGSVRGRIRYRCVKCRKSLGENFPDLKNSIKEIIRSLLTVIQKGSFNRAEKLTGHKTETLQEWRKKLQKHYDQILSSSYVSIFKDFGIEINDFRDFLNKSYKKDKRILSQSKLVVKKSNNSVEHLIPLLKKAINKNVIHTKDINVKEAIEILYDPLWKKLILPQSSLESIPMQKIGEINSADKDLLNEFVQTLPKAIVILELAARWSEAKDLLIWIYKIMHKATSELSAEQKIIQQRISDNWGKNNFIDWCFLKACQFEHKINAARALELNYQRDSFQSQKKFKPELLLNTKAWKVLFLMEAGRVEEKQVFDNLNVVIKEYSPKSLFPRELLARYFSLKAMSARSFEKKSILTEMEKVSDDILNTLMSNNSLDRIKAKTYIYLARLNQHHQAPFYEEMGRL